MKHKLYIGFSLLVMFCSQLVFAQKRLTEATISYDIVINTNNAKPEAADMLDGATGVVIFDTV